MSAKQQAIADIRQELHHTSRSFIAFRTELNPKMASLVEGYIQKQQSL